MPQVTDIKPQKKSGRFNIFIDDRFALGINAESLAKSGLKINQEVTEEKIQQLIKEDDAVKVYDNVLKFYSFRPRSKRELTDWFKRKEVGFETQEYIIKKLEKLNLINDSEFAKWFVDQRTKFRHSGFRLIKMELRQKGISDEIISNIESQVSSISELDQARKILDKKMKTFTLSNAEGRKTLTAFLARRGFSWEMINKVCKEYLIKQDLDEKEEES